MQWVVRLRINRHAVHISASLLVTCFLYILDQGFFFFSGMLCASHHRSCRTSNFELDSDKGIVNNSLTKSIASARILWAYRYNEVSSWSVDRLSQSVITVSLWPLDIRWHYFILWLSTASFWRLAGCLVYIFHCTFFSWKNLSSCPNRMT